MEDQTLIAKHEGIVIEAENEKQVQDLVQSDFKTKSKSFVESPEDMIRKFARQELIIDKVKKFWKYKEILFFLLFQVPQRKTQFLNTSYLQRKRTSF